MKPWVAPSTTVMTAITHRLAPWRPIRPRYVLRSYASRWLGLMIWPALGLAAAAPVALILLVTGDYRPMVVNTDSMQPALENGDVIVNEVVAPAEIKVGDIVAYSDDLRGGAVITERVLEVSEQAGAYSFATTGDSSSRVEHWSIDQSGSVGRVAYRAPGLGRWLAAATSGLPGAALLAGITILVIGVLARPFRLDL